MIFSNITSILEVIFVTVPGLLTVAYVTVAERKTMASMQRRLGPNLVGYYGLLQAFADALKLLLKEYVSPTQSNFILFFLGPVITLVFSLLSFAVIPYGCGLTLFDFDLGILYLLAVSSLSTYGILLAGWSANSKYAFLGSLRSTAQLISYELILSSAIFIVVLVTGSLNLTTTIEYQNIGWFVTPLFPVFIVFFISCIAETNRAPFDLAEAESELVSGFMTEHAAVIFVFFFLAEYTSIVIICMLTSILFLGGYLLNTSGLNGFFYTVNYSSDGKVGLLDLLQVCSQKWNNLWNNLFDLDLEKKVKVAENYPSNKSSSIRIIKPEQEIMKEKQPRDSLYHYAQHLLTNNTVSYNDYLEAHVKKGEQAKLDRVIFINALYSTLATIIQATIESVVLGVKSSLMIFIFIWTRASFPRIRFDQLMSFCWTVLLPIVVAFIVLIPCLLHGFDILPTNIIIL